MKTESTVTSAKEKNCVNCGKSFVALRWNSIRCPECSKKFSHHKKKENLEDLTSEGETSDLGSGATRCLYCGKKIREGKSFCHFCLEEGFDNVYKVTHRSNGWEKRLSRACQEKVVIKSGWRGQRVTGCTIPANSDKYLVAL